MGRDWETTAELRGPKVTDENPVRHTRRRSTKQWCKGKVGVEHVPEVTLDRYTESLRRYPRQDEWLSACQWQNWIYGKPDHGWRFHCWHQRRCVNCGKILNRLEDQECPDYTPRISSSSTSADTGA